MYTDELAKVFTPDAYPKLAEAVRGLEVLRNQPTVANAEAVEKALDKGEFWVFPGKGTKVGWRMRRWFPERIWNYTHKVEGW